MVIAKESSMRVLDTFAGAGGFSLGFEMAGCEVVGAVEMDRWACDTFGHNHPGARVFQGDISKITDDEFATAFGGERKPDIVIGGPPCQGFSIANRNAGDSKDPRNSLFKEFVRVGRIFQPKLMVMENVPNLLAARTQEGAAVIEIIAQSLRDLGYHVYWKTLQATDYGVPQIRTRLFVVASHVELANPFPAPTHRARGDNYIGDLYEESLPDCPTLWEAISDLPELAASEGGEEGDYGSQPTNEYQVALRAGSGALYNHKAMNHTPRMVERFTHMQWGHSVNDVPSHLKPRKRNSQELAVNAYDQNNRRMFPHRPCHTVPASFYANFVHPYQHRNFTAREGARIQSFPDSFRFLGKPTVVSHKLLAREGREGEKFLCQYNQIGNAVPPLLSKALASHLLKQLDNHQEKMNVRPRQQSRAKRKSPDEVSG
jgi:DNA (cytosine-5)-methyltransferase 1